MAIKSIQVQTTKLTGAGVQVVPHASSERTHWSLYLRNEEGIVEWVEDITIGNNSARSFEMAHIAAAKLSMLHQVPIERIF